MMQAIPTHPESLHRDLRTCVLAFQSIMASLSGTRIQRRVSRILCSSSLFATSHS
jgi:hypothetical protein